MRELAHKFSNIARSEKAFTWFKLISVTGGAQLIVQAIGLVSGIIVIRLLSTAEYGLYTLANTMLGTMVILADGGISAGVLAKGGKVWKDKEQLGIVLATGLDLRKKFAVGSLLLAIPILFLLLRHHGASWMMTGIIVACLIPAFFTALSGTLLQIVPKLNQDILPLQKNHLIANIARLGSLLSLFIFPWAFVAVLAYGIPQIWANFNLRKISAKYANWGHPADPVLRQEILVFVRRMLPGAIYYCLSGQISIWIISVFGSTSSVAQVGALGRLAMLLNLFNVVFTTLISPRFARLPTSKNILLKRFLQIQFIVLVVNATLIMFTWLFSGQILWILGKEYAHLNSELVLNIIGSCIGLFAGISFSLFTSRGWALHPLISIPVSIASMAAGVFLFNIGTLKGVLFLNIFVAIIQVVMNGLYCIIKILKTNRKNFQYQA